MNADAVPTVGDMSANKKSERMIERPYKERSGQSFTVDRRTASKSSGDSRRQRGFWDVLS